MRSFWDGAPGRRWRARLVGLGEALLLLLGAAALVTWWTDSPADAAPVFEEVPCWSPRAGAAAHCGYLIVPESTFIEFPHLAHGSVSLDPCADRIAANFLDHPERAPRDECLAALAPARFRVPDWFSPPPQQ